MRGAAWVAAVLVVSACVDRGAPRAEVGAGAAAGTSAARLAPAVAVVQAGSTVGAAQEWLTPVRRAEEEAFWRAAAEAAWRFANRTYVASTGINRPFDGYYISTMWDAASGLAASFAAAELGLLDRAEYDRRTARALATLERVPLFDGRGFNKEYLTTSGMPIGIQRRPSERGYGTSATDHGRLLLWLKIIANRHPQHRAAVERVVRRLDLDEYLDDGYLQGRQLSRRTGRGRDFQEGRLGYEQYAARGFALWGARAEHALDIGENARPTDVLGVRVLADRRGGDRLTSEPFILLGMEAGWQPAERSAAEAVLAAQEARWRRTRTLTMVSEDAINQPPDYFFYYGVLTRNGPFSLDVQRPNVRLDGPRWVSTKAAFAWHALLPRDYTRLVVDSVRSRALVGGVWGSGVFERGGATGNPNINTAAVVLEAALYRRVGRPFVQLGRG